MKKLESSQEIFEQLEYCSEKYILIHFSAFINHTPNGIHIIPDENEYWYYQMVGKFIDEEELKNIITETDWNLFLGDTKEGLYEFKLLLSVERDSDDYRSWIYYVTEHVECEFLCSIEDNLKQLEEFNSLTSEDLFSF